MIMTALQNTESSRPAAGWFPGHMFKAERAMKESLSLVDLVIQIVDARAPLMSRNPKLLQWLNNRPHIVLANKADLSSAEGNRQWRRWFEDHGEPVDFLEAWRLRNPVPLAERWKALIEKKRAERGATRPLLRPFRVMIVGIPNIGKSTLINHLKSRNVTRVGPKPGVTRQNQWVSIAAGLELLDTPGILWPSLRDPVQEQMLTLLGNIPDEAGDPVRTACFLIRRLKLMGIPMPWTKLDLNGDFEEPEEALEALAKRRGMLLPGGVPAITIAAAAFLKDYRNGRLGRWTLETPPADDIIAGAESGAEE